MSGHDHNRLTKEFVLNVASKTSNSSELMVVIESCIFAAMLILNKVYGFAPSGCVEMIESAIHRATERFVDDKP